MKFEDIRKLHQKKFREEAGFFLLEGEHLVQELQKAARHDPRLRPAKSIARMSTSAPRAICRCM